MVKNDFKREIDHLLIDERITKREVSKRLGVFPQQISQIVSASIVSKRFVEMLDVLGYDIKVEYVKRDCGEGQK